MVGVVVAGHGGFAAGMAANVKMLAGSDAELKAVDFADGMDVEVFEKQLAEAIDSYADCEAVLVLADIAGGTPYNRAAGAFDDPPQGACDLRAEQQYADGSVHAQYHR